MQRDEIPWDFAALRECPGFEFAPEFRAQGAEKNEAEGVRALFYDGPKWRGKNTRVFAWYGVPENAGNEKLPAMVLVHGGGGTAFADWVRMWNDRGYAAISMDTCGCVAGGDHDTRPRHDVGGPPGWGAFDKAGEAPADQWMYHAVADVILANTLIRSFPEIDPERIGLSGISWGGVISCIVAGIDPRFAFVNPVYGTAFAKDDWSPEAQAIEIGEHAQTWLELWNPAHYLEKAAMPMLWVTGTNDFAFPLAALQHSYRLARGERTLSVQLRMAHGQEDGASPQEIAAYADSHLKGGVPLPWVGSPERGGGALEISFRSSADIRKAELLYTKDSGVWLERHWETALAKLDAASCRATAKIPPEAAVCFINLRDERGLIVSSEHVTL